MKKLIIFLTTCVLFACTSSQPKSYYTTVMIDVTDEKTAPVTSQQIKAHALLPEVSASMYFSVVHVNESAYNRHQGVFISRADVGVLYDEMSRKLVTKDYNNKVDSLLNEISDVPYGTASSNVFRAVVSEARFLMKQNCDQRKIALYSDLIENSSFFSLKNRAHRKLLEKPEELQAFFESQFQLDMDESFQGLEIEVYYFPDMETEAHFDHFFALYQHIFESKGATVTHAVSIIKSVEV